MGVGETDCFYSNQSMVTRENLSMVMENLKERKERRQYQKGISVCVSLCLPGLRGLTTLLSALASHWFLF